MSTSTSFSQARSQQSTNSRQDWSSAECTRARGAYGHSRNAAARRAFAHKRSNPPTSHCKSLLGGAPLFLLSLGGPMRGCTETGAGIGRERCRGAGIERGRCRLRRRLGRKRRKRVSRGPWVFTPSRCAPQRGSSRFCTFVAESGRKVESEEPGSIGVNHVIRKDSPRAFQRYNSRCETRSGRSSKT